MAKPSIDLAGTRVGQLTVMRRDGHIGCVVAWLCVCDCGNTTRKRTGELTRQDKRRARSCGCAKRLRGPDSPGWSGHGLISAKAWHAVKSSARIRSYELSVTIEDAWRVFQAQGQRCALTGWPLTMGTNASFDRIDPTRGYVHGNVQWVHAEINVLKSDRSERELLDLCRALVKWADEREPSEPVEISSVGSRRLNHNRRRAMA